MANGNDSKQKTPQQSQADYYHQMAQAYGMTDDQFNEVIGGTSTKNYGQPTSYFTPTRQVSPGGQWRDISPQQNANFASLQQLNQVGLLPQQPPQQPQQSSLSDMWNAYMQQGRGQAVQPAAASVATPTQTAVAQPRATIPIATIPAIQAPAAPGVGQQWQQPQQQRIPGFQTGGWVLPSDQSQQNQSQQNFPYIQGQAPNNYIPNLYPLYGMSAMGAAALGGAPMVINPTPNQGVMSKGGIYTGGQLPTVYGPQTAGTAPTPVSSQGGGGAPQGYQGVPNAPTQYVSSTANMPAGPWNVMPGLFAAQPMPTPSTGPGIQPTMPANAAGYRPAGQSGTPWATAPMPGQTPIPPSSITAPPAPNAFGGAGPMPVWAHTSALRDAGMALYAHLTGGDPSTASHADIADFHSRLTGAIGSASGVPGGALQTAAANYTAGAAVTPPKRMQSGGPVPPNYPPGDPRNNTDSTLIAATPGEYVLNREQAKRLSEVPGLLKPSQPAQTPSTGAQSQPSSSTAQGSSGSLGSSGGGGIDWNAIAQARASQVALNSGGASGGGYNIPGGGGYIGASPGPGQSGYAYPNQGAATAAGDVGTGMGGGVGAGAVGAIGGLASGLAAAAQTYAKSVGSWQMKPSAIPQPQGAQGAATQFQQEQIV